MNRSLIKEQAKSILKANWIYVLLGVIIVGAGTALSAFVLGIIALPLMAGLFLFLKQLIKENKTDFNNFINPYKNLNRAVNICGVALLVSLLIMLGTFLFIIPGIIWGLQYSQAIRIISENEDMDIMTALRKSKEMMDGYKMDLFVFQLSFILHILLCVITFGIYGLWFIPYYELANANYYLHLKHLHEPKEEPTITNEFDATVVDEDKLI